MLRPIIDPVIAQEALDRVHLITVGPYDLSPAWLGAESRVVLAEESGDHFDADQCARLETAMQSCGPERLVAVANEPLKNAVLVYALDATAADLAAFSWECGHFNFALLPEHGVECCVLCSTADFILVAGSRILVDAYAGDLHEARRRFVEFVGQTFFEPIKAPLRRAVDLMSWIGDAS